MSRCDSAAIVPNTSELLPDPETPVNTVSQRFGISTLTSLRLFTRAPCTLIRSWLLAASGLVALLIRVSICSGQPAAVAHHVAAGQFVLLAPRLDPARHDAKPAVR